MISSNRFFSIFQHPEQMIGDRKGSEADIRAIRCILDGFISMRGQMAKETTNK
jgi:hypothetical protein